jgi:hypothetical protein
MMMDMPNVFVVKDFKRKKKWWISEELSCDKEFIQCHCLLSQVKHWMVHIQLQGLPKGHWQVVKS